MCTARQRKPAIRPILIPALQASIRLTDRRPVEGWVNVGGWLVGWLYWTRIHTQMQVGYNNMNQLTAAMPDACLLSARWRICLSAEVWLPPSDRLLLAPLLESVVCTALVIGKTPCTKAASDASTCNGMFHCAFISSDKRKHNNTR